MAPFKDGTMLEAREIKKSFSGTCILSHLNVSVSKQETVFVLGRSGVGKSVLLRLMVGLIPLDEGQIWLNGVPINFYDRKTVLKLRSQVGLVFQKPALLDHLTLKENLLFGLKERPKTLNKQMEALGLSERDLNKQVQEASFGMQKKVSVMRTLLRKPEFLLFDEPTTGLDPISTEAMNQLMLIAKKESNAGALIVSHDIKSALKYADRILLLDESRIIFQGTASEFLSSHHPAVRGFLFFEQKGAQDL